MSLQDKFDRAQSLRKSNLNPSECKTLLLDIINNNNIDNNIDLIEKSIYSLGSLYASLGEASSLSSLLVSIRPFFGFISKAKTGKIIRTLINQSALINQSNSNYKLLISLCINCISWCKKENRIFLKQQIECKLCEYYLCDIQYQLALKLINRLILDIKKLDDKHLLVEIHLIESKIHHSLHNIAKSKAALTASRAAGNSIYIAPLLQSSIDMQAGCIASEEKDYKTAYSYFYEAFEGYDGLKLEKNAYLALKYMLLMKIMNNQADDVNSVISGKLAINYKSSDINILKNIAICYRERSLNKFELIINNKNNKFLYNDIVIKNKLKELKNKLLKENLLRLLEPYEVVEIKHIAELIKLPINTIQTKLSQMILDKEFNGILDQGTGTIIVFDEQESTNLYQNAVNTINELNEVVDHLFDKSKLLD